MKKAVFLDRDGVINSDEGHYYIYKIEDFKLNTGIVQGLGLLLTNNFLLFVITNQGGVAKGIYTKNDINKIHLYLKKKLAEYQIFITEIYCCPHHESVSKCKCRKPSPYFIEKAKEKYDLNLHQSFFIGNSETDMLTAKAAGVKGIKIKDNENIIPYCKIIINDSFDGKLY